MIMKINKSTVYNWIKALNKKIEEHRSLTQKKKTLKK